jgi:hypothetical protein
MSLFFLFSYVEKSEAPSQVSHYKKWMNILFWVVLVVFSIVRTKIVHYSSLTYFPMSFLATWYIYQLVKNGKVVALWKQMIFLGFVLFLGTAFFLLGNLECIKEPLLEALKNDQLAFGNFSQSIPDGRLDWLIAMIFFIVGFSAVLLINRGKTNYGVAGLFGGTLITVTLLSVFIAPKIDSYTQRSLFGLYKEKSSEAYFKPIIMHSYAHLFYANRMPIESNPDNEFDWMMFEKTDKPVYFVCREQDVEKAMGWYSRLAIKERRGGYVILVRTDKDYPFLGSL